MSKKTLNDLFLHMLKDVYYAEQKITKALPKMEKAATNQDLKKAFAHHLEETRGQVERLKKVFDSIGEKAEGVECAAIEGLISEGDDVMDEYEGDVLDVGLLAAAQAIEHYEIARYGTLITWAEQLGLDEAVQLLQDNISQEKRADSHLNDLALHGVNTKLKAA
jgi:ferritin-like metal-binding protein YciE